MNRQGSSRRRVPSGRRTLGVSTPTRKQRKEVLVEREQQYVGIDLHRRRSVIVRMNDAGEVLGVSRIDNDPVALSMAVAEAGPDPEVVLEACYGWYWAADLLQANGARVHLVHPLGLHWDTRRVKNDVKDATELAHRLRRNDVPEAWIAPGPGSRVAGAGALPGQADRPADVGQGPGARGDGQAGDPAAAG
jgi:transposase